MFYLLPPSSTSSYSHRHHHHHHYRYHHQSVHHHRHAPHTIIIISSSSSSRSSNNRILNVLSCVMKWSSLLCSSSHWSAGRAMRAPRASASFSRATAESTSRETLWRTSTGSAVGCNPVWRTAHSQLPTTRIDAALCRRRYVLFESSAPFLATVHAYGCVEEEEFQRRWRHHHESCAGGEFYLETA